MQEQNKNKKKQGKENKVDKTIELNCWCVLQKHHIPLFIKHGMVYVTNIEFNGSVCYNMKFNKKFMIFSNLGRLWISSLNNIFIIYIIFMMIFSIILQPVKKSLSCQCFLC